MKSSYTREIVYQFLQEQAKKSLLASISITGVQAAIFEEHVIHKVCNTIPHAHWKWAEKR